MAALMQMQHLLGCLLLVVWSFWLLNHIVKILDFMLKGLGLLTLSAHQQMQQQGAASKILCTVLSMIFYVNYHSVAQIVLEMHKNLTRRCL